MENRNETGKTGTGASEAAQTQTEIPQRPANVFPEHPSTALSSPQRTGKKLLVLGLLGLVIIAVAMTGYVAYQNVRPSNEQSGSEQTNVNPASTQSPAAATDQTTPASIAGSDDIPQINSLYLGTYENSEGIFVTDEEKQKYFDPGAVPKTSPYIGDLNTGGGGYAPFDFRELKNPRKIFTGTKHIVSVNDFSINNTGTFVYVSLDYRGEAGANATNKIIKIDIQNGTGVDVWSNVIGSAKYEGAGGVALVDTIVDDTYLTFRLLNCYACEPDVAGAGILNIITKQDTYHKDIGNVQINVPDNSYSYQKLAPFEDVCSLGLGCDDGKRTVYKPSGRIYTESLP